MSVQLSFEGATEFSTGMVIAAAVTPFAANIQRRIASLQPATVWVVHGSAALLCAAYAFTRGDSETATRVASSLAGAVIGTCIAKINLDSLPSIDPRRFMRGDQPDPQRGERA